MTASQTGHSRPRIFHDAVTALRSVSPPHHITVEEIDAPTTVAPHAFAVSATVGDEIDSEVTGRLVLLHDPEGAPGWDGTLRLVTYVSARVDEKTVLDPRLPETVWARFTEGLRRHRASYTSAGGTVTTTSSTPMGGLADDRIPDSAVEVRASWTPAPESIPRQFRAWCELLWSMAGSP